MISSNADESLRTGTNVQLASGGARPCSYAWKLVGMLCVVAMLNYLDRLMITTMRDPIRADLHATDAQFGLFTSVFLWSYAACSPLGGFLADRFGKRKVILASLLFWSAATVASALAHTAHQMLTARVLMGVSEACYIPAALALIADYHRGPTRSLATGLHMVGLYVGATLGGMGGYLADYAGWRFGFRLFGGIGIVYFFFLFFALHDAPQSTAPTTSHSSPISRPRFSVVLRDLLSVPGFWLMLLVNILIGIVNWAVYGWLPTFLKTQFQLGNGAAGMSATTYIQVSSFVGVLVAGAAADRWSRRNPRARSLIPGIGYLLAAPCLFAAASTPWLALAIGGLVIFGLGRGAFDANQMPIVRELVDEHHSATAYGLLNFIGTAAGGVMVYVGGALMDAHVDLSHVFQFCGACLAGVAIILLILPGSDRRSRLANAQSASDSTPTSEAVRLGAPGAPADTRPGRFIA